MRLLILTIDLRQNIQFLRNPIKIAIEFEISCPIIGEYQSNWLTEILTELVTLNILVVTVEGQFFIFFKHVI